MLRLKAHVASVCFKCFRCMLQVFYMGVAKVDRNVAYVAMVVQAFVSNGSSVFSYVCCKCVYLNVALLLQHMFASVLSGRCVCFFYNGFKCFSGVLCKCFRYMFQVFHLASNVCCKCYI
jgi:hypothetical protein